MRNLGEDSKKSAKNVFRDEKFGRGFEAMHPTIKTRIFC